MSLNNYLKLDWRTSSLVAGRDGVEEGLVEIGGNEKVFVVTANLSESTRVSAFAKKYPERFLDLGVAEQNMIGVASGLALDGYTVFASSFAVFSPGRSYDQVRVSVALTNANVKLIGGHGGVSVGENGPSHQALEDIAMMRVLPRMVVLTPTDANQTKAAIEAAYRYQGPVYIRTTRPKTANYTKELEFEIGKIYKYREGKDITIAACGIQVFDSLMVAEDLAKEGIECEVLNVSTIKPFDTTTLVESAKKTGRVVTVEDHQIAGGLGGVVSETLSQNIQVPLKRVGINDRFGESADWESLYQEMGLDRASLYQQIKSMVA